VRLSRAVQHQNQRQRKENWQPVTHDSHGRLIGDSDVFFKRVLDGRPFAFDESLALGGVCRHGCVVLLLYHRESLQ
jgi:hypothetical protein